MGVYGLTNFTGAPGVTTTAVAWAYLTDRPTLVVEADNTGGSPILAGAFRATQPHDRSVLQLSARPAGMTLGDHLWALTLTFPGQEDRYLLPAVAEPQQAGSLRGLWEPLGRAFQHVSSQGGYDVLVDLGRFPHAPAYQGLLQHLDALAVFVPAHLPGINSAAIDMPRLRDTLGEITGGTSETTRIGVVLTGSPGSTYGTGEAGKALAPVPVLTTLPHDPAAAGVYHRGDPAPRSPIPGRDPSATYRKAVTVLAAAVRAQATTYAQTMKGESA